MTRKFVDLEEAAKMLGVTPDVLGEMRERRQVFGYRDGANWKFKTEDIERLATERAEADQEGDFAEIDEDPDSILLSEVELGQSNESTSSTIIGGRADIDNAADSDIQLAKPVAEKAEAALADSDIQIARPKTDSDLDLGAELGSDVKGGSGVIEGGSSGVSPLFDELDTLDLEMPSAADSGISSDVHFDPAGSKAAGASDVKLASDILGLADSTAAPILADSPLAPPAGSGAIAADSGLSVGGDEELALGSDSGLEGGSAIDLSEDVDDDLVLGGSSHGDLSRTGDSGISLLDPADSGLSLESPPLELGGSGVESLELGEDEGAEEPAAKTVVKAGAPVMEEASEDDFLLTPPDEAGSEESDSGSQVIAVEDDVDFGEAATSGVGDEGLGSLLEEDLGEGLSEGLGAAAELSTVGIAPAGGLQAAAAAGGTPAGVFMAPEPAYSIWNVMSLTVCVLLLMFCGMFTYDLMRNMWSWEQPYGVNSSMMEMILSWFE